MKILRAWINIRINSFLDKYDETKMGEVPWKLLVAQKIRACSLKNTAPRHLFIIALFFFSETNFNLVLTE